MTRFARAKGSKSSNEKLPNEATPWHVLKQQLLENSSKQEPTPKNKSAKQLLQNKKEVFYCDVGNVNNDWAEFEESTVKGTNNNIKKNKKKNKNEASLNDKTVPVSNKNEDNVSSQKKIKKKLKRSISEVDNSTTDTNVKKCKTDKKAVDNSNIHEKEENSSSQGNEKLNDATVEHNNLKKIKKKKRNKSKNLETDISQNETNEMTASNNTPTPNLNEKNNRPPKQKRDKTGFKSNNEKNDVSHRFNRNNINKFGNPKFNANKNNNRMNNRKLPKIRDDKEHKRRKPDVGPMKIVINGMEIEIVKYDGYPVRKEDAERLRELRQKMIMKGIPKKEIDIAMKLERRKAEKALARLRKCVCFHCRKTGHNLSDCPELGSEQIGTGICFKCGSTEHTHFECKVAKPTEFRYATCFICREQGHIAKQCPDNPKGIYPQGGSCKVCGDVTHLKKDCPDLIKEKEESTITVNTIENNNIESLEGSAKAPQVEENKKSKKVVKF